MKNWLVHNCIFTCAYSNLKLWED
ncbi:hypothetical protein EMIT0P100_10244 [Pseudomonas sp. IT-P100]